jgi:ribonuclease Z
MRTLFEPRLVNDTFGDPGLYVDFRDEHRALLFDLGDLGSLPPRKLMRLSHVFVTHTHMDHFAGFDHLLRVVLGRKPHLAICGGPGFVLQVEHKLRAYTWNVVHHYEVPLDIDVYEIGLDGRGRRARFSSREAFERSGTDDFDVAGDVLHDEATFRVRGRFVDHDIACLSYAIEEKAHVNVRKERVAGLGLAAGAWLRDLKHAVLSGAPPDTPIDVRWRDRDGDHAVRRTIDDLCDVILDVVPGQRLGYVTDLRYTQSNVKALTELLSGVDSLFIECVFLEEDRDHATRKNHLTAHQAGLIARTVGARHVVPFHFSPRYEDRAAELVAEMQQAWKGQVSGAT